MDVTPPHSPTPSLGERAREVVGARSVTESMERVGAIVFAKHPAWTERFPWLVHGITGRGDGEPFDLGVFGPTPSRTIHERWDLLARAIGARRVIHGRQVHGARVRLYREGPPGFLTVSDTDGHVTATPGDVLAVATADCVPVTLVDPGRRAVGLLHAGWRGVAARILRRGVEVMRDRLGSDTAALALHLGPAICGACYEVGPEVHRALGVQPPDRPAPVDLRRELARRAVRLGLAPDAITISSHCTRCGDSPFFSHRAGASERQVAFVGLAW